MLLQQSHPHPIRMHTHDIFDHTKSKRAFYTGPNATMQTIVSNVDGTSGITLHTISGKHMSGKHVSAHMWLKWCGRQDAYLPVFFGTHGGRGYRCQQSGRQCLERLSDRGLHSRTTHWGQQAPCVCMNSTCQDYFPCLHQLPDSHSGPYGIEPA